jgi:hypothetical protein
VADPYLEIARRNARLRAWRAHGVPIEGCWERVGHSVRVRLRCQACGLEGQPSEPLSSKAEPHRWRTAEDWQVRDITDKGCRHLASHLLVATDPPEVITITELELLAGG